MVPYHSDAFLSLGPPLFPERCILISSVHDAYAERLVFAGGMYHTVRSLDNPIIPVCRNRPLLSEVVSSRLPCDTQNFSKSNNCTTVRTRILFFTYYKEGEMTFRVRFMSFRESSLAIQNLRCEGEEKSSLMPLIISFKAQRTLAFILRRQRTKKHHDNPVLSSSSQCFFYQAHLTSYP